ncbi:hypothetical protein TWF694_003581 [Orbilia ellipsospora]|uniref:Mg2+ transporter n=1 Tax=Orbilia ellipsospora TaxID=2528407 RepID=A0AAV9WYM9_9PEZI
MQNAPTSKLPSAPQIPTRDYSEYTETTVSDSSQDERTYSRFNPPPRAYGKTAAGRQKSVDVEEQSARNPQKYAKARYGSSDSDLEPESPRRGESSRRQTNSQGNGRENISPRNEYAGPSYYYQDADWDDEWEEEDDGDDDWIISSGRDFMPPPRKLNPVECGWWYDVPLKGPQEEASFLYQSKLFQDGTQVEGNTYQIVAANQLGSEAHKSTKTEILHIISSRRSLAAEPDCDNIKLYTAKAGQKQPADKHELQFRWIHFQNKVLNLEEFKQRVLKIPGLDDNDTTILWSLFENVKPLLERSFVNGKYLNGGVIRCDGKRPGENKASTFLAVPMLRLQDLDAGLYRHPQKYLETSDHPTRPLMQTGFHRVSTLQMDKEQAVLKSKLLSRNQALHVPMTWILVINDNLLVTYSSVALREVAGPQIGFEEQKSQRSMILVISSVRNNGTYFFDSEKCKTWFEFQKQLQKVVRWEQFEDKLSKDRTSMAYNEKHFSVKTLDDVVLGAQNWAAQLAEHKSKIFRVKLEIKLDNQGGRYQYPNLNPNLPYAPTYPQSDEERSEPMLPAPPRPRASPYSMSRPQESKYDPSRKFSESPTREEHRGSTTSPVTSPQPRSAPKRATVEDALDEDLLPNKESSPADHVSESRRSRKQTPALLTGNSNAYPVAESSVETRERREMRNQQREIGTEPDFSNPRRHSVKYGYLDTEKKTKKEEIRSRGTYSDDESESGTENPDAAIRPSKAVSIHGRDSALPHSFTMKRYDSWVEDDYDSAARAAALRHRLQRQTHGLGFRENLQRLDTSIERSSRSLMRQQPRGIKSQESLQEYAPLSKALYGSQNGSRYSYVLRQNSLTPAQGVEDQSQNPKSMQISLAKTQKDIYYIPPSERALQAKKVLERKEQEQEKATPKLPEVLPVFQWPTESSLQTNAIEKKLYTKKMLHSSMHNDSAPQSPRQPFKKENPLKASREASDDSFKTLANILDDLHQTIMDQEPSSTRDRYVSCGSSSFSEVKKVLKGFEDIDILSAESADKENLQKRLENKKQIVELSKNIFSFFIPLYWKDYKVVDCFWYGIQEVIAAESDEFPQLRPLYELLDELMITKMQNINTWVLVIRTGVAGDDKEAPQYCIPRALVEAFQIFFDACFICLRVAQTLSEALKYLQNKPKAPFDPAEVVDLIEYSGRLFDGCRSKLREGKYQLTSMILTGNNKDQARYEGACTETIVAFALRQLMCASLTDLPQIKTPGNIYSERLSYLLLAAKNRPSQRIIKDVSNLKDEIETLQKVMYAQVKVLTAADHLLHPKGSLQILGPIQNRTACHLIPRETMCGIVGSSINLEIHATEELIERCSWLRDSVQEALDMKDEDHGKAIMVFTIVTTIFLPLNFVTSFFGMNTVDIRNISWKQGIFWITAIPVTIVVLVLAMVWAYYGDEIQERLKEPYRAWGSKSRKLMAKTRESAIYRRDKRSKGASDVGEEKLPAADTAFTAKYRYNTPPPPPMYPASPGDFRPPHQPTWGSRAYAPRQNDDGFRRFQKQNYDGYQSFVERNTGSRNNARSRRREATPKATGVSFDANLPRYRRGNYGNSP